MPPLTRQLPAPTVWTAGNLNSHNSQETRVLRTLNDVPEPDDAIECDDWLDAGQRRVVFRTRAVGQGAMAGQVGLGGWQDFTGAVGELHAWIGSYLELGSPQAMRECAAELLAGADMWERLEARYAA